MTRFLFAVATIVLVGIVSAFSQDPGRAEISGRVVYDNASLPGVRVSAIGAGKERSVVTNANGRFTIPGLSPGNYQIRLELPGFQTITRAVAITAPGVVSFDFVLEVGCLSEVLEVDLGWVWALEHADAVVVLRILETGGAQRWNLDQSCLIATEHVATVSDVLKLTAPADARPLTIRLLELGDRPSYAAGDEYIALLTWQPTIGRYQPLARPFMFPVHDGRVVWTRSDAPGFIDGMSVEAFLAQLRSALLVREANVERNLMIAPLAQHNGWQPNTRMEPARPGGMKPGRKKPRGSFASR